MSKKSTTFDAYRARHKKNRTENIRSAIKILSNASYSNITRLSKDVAKVVTEFERSDNDKLPASERQILAPVNHITLLRNADYRLILEVAFNKLADTTPDDVPSISDLEALKIRNANLESQNAILKERIRSFDLGRDIPSISYDQINQDKILAKEHDVNFLLKLVDGIQEQLHQALKTILPGEETNNYPVAGFYGPSGLIATYDEMLELNRIRNEQN